MKNPTALDDERRLQLYADLVALVSDPREGLTVAPAVGGLDVAMVRSAVAPSKLRVATCNRRMALWQALQTGDQVLYLARDLVGNAVVRWGQVHAVTRDPGCPRLVYLADGYRNLHRTHSHLLVAVVGVEGGGP